LLENAEAVCNKFADLETKAKAKVDLAAHVSEISDTLDGFLNKFDEREDILRQL